MLKKDIDELEKVQQRALRLMTNVRGSCYEERLRNAGLTPLTIRRLRADLIEVFKVLNGLYKVREDAWFTRIAESSRATRQTVRIDGNGIERRRDMLIVPRARLEVRNNFFSIRAAEEWNSLPDEVKDAETISIFKRKLDNHLDKLW